jgi:hypothetical protein
VLQVTDEFKKTFEPLTHVQMSMVFDIYCITAEDEHKVTLISDPGCTKAGSMTVYMKGKGVHRPFEVTMVFGATEISMAARDISSGETRTAKLKFLTDLRSNDSTVTTALPIVFDPWAVNAHVTSPSPLLSFIHSVTIAGVLIDTTWLGYILIMSRARVMNLWHPWCQHQEIYQ